MVDKTVMLNSNIHLGVAIIKVQLPQAAFQLPVNMAKEPAEIIRKNTQSRLEKDWIFPLNE